LGTCNARRVDHNLGLSDEYTDDDKTERIEICNVGRVRNYLSRPGDCRACEFKAQCTRAPFRKIARNEEARDYARSLKDTPKFAQSSDERKKVEMRFAHLKVQHRFERLRLRGLTGANDEFVLAAIAQNLKTLAKQPCQPPPNHS
jgi:hypothetical protein